MRISGLEIIHLRLPLVSPFETSFGAVRETETLLVRAEAEGREGWGECPASAAPSYSSETVHTARYIITEFLAPLLRDADIASPADLPALFRRIRGHNMAKGGVEMALWDLTAKIKNVSLSRLIGGSRSEIPTGVSIGIQPTPDDLLRTIEGALAKGYRRIKLKIKPGWDTAILETVRRRFGAIPLMADANAAYTLEQTDHLMQLDRFDLMMLEQPLDEDDIVDHRLLQEKMKTPLCLDESIKSPEDGRRALDLGSCRIVNIKQARVGGTSRAIRLHDLCRDRGVPVWCGGLLESGVGRLHNIALASLENFTLPGDISASERYYQEDIVDPPVRLTDRGTILVPDGAGIGATIRVDMVERYCVGRSDVL
ncbi:MAG: o-succinylbenzoate synthase [Planctomycetes bacterium RBG_16_59_8]|nr:MAG: o-succinylbenzoate synthase [Planctomycetes bacterium RBG_16_59_8]